jgi:hypothetical protein
MSEIQPTRSTNETAGGAGKFQDAHVHVSLNESTGAIFVGLLALFLLIALLRAQADYRKLAERFADLQSKGVHDDKPSV